MKYNKDYKRELRIIEKYCTKSLRSEQLFYFPAVPLSTTSLNKTYKRTTYNRESLLYSNMRGECIEIHTGFR